MPDPIGFDKRAAIQSGAASSAKAIGLNMSWGAGISEARLRWLLCAAMILAAFGAKLWVIAHYSNPTPYWDEWDEAAASYVPYFDSTLTLKDLLAPHNEHRLMTSRVATLLLITANGLWDPVLQMIFNAAVHVGVGVLVLKLLGRHLDTFGYAAVAVLLTIMIAVPYDWENVLMGMETQFYCVILFSLLAMYLIARSGDLSAASILGLIAAALAFFSVVSGALAFLACLAVVVSYRLLGLVKGWQPWVLAALLLLAFVLAVESTPTIEVQKTLGAHSVREFRKAFLALASWPLWPYVNVGAFVLNLPWIWLAWRTLRRPPEAGNVAWVLLAFGLWNGLQFAALAYGRALAIAAPRYFDSVTFNVILNGVCLSILCGRRRIVQVAWIGFVLVGLYAQSRSAWTGAQWRFTTALRQESNVKSFLASGHFLPGASGEDFSLPYPHTERLTNLLSDPRVRRILPSNLQAAIPREGAGDVERRDRLGVLRDALLRCGPYLAGAGMLLWLSLITGFLLQTAAYGWRQTASIIPGTFGK